MSHLSQMVGIVGLHFFVSSAVGMALAAAFIRGLTRRHRTTVGNFWVDTIRTCFGVMIPITFVFALVFMSQGVIQNFHASRSVTTAAVQSVDAKGNPVATQSVPGGPIASMVSIEALGDNGGGAFNANMAHPFQNPNGITNVLFLWLSERGDTLGAGDDHDLAFFQRRPYPFGADPQDPGPGVAESGDDPSFVAREGDRLVALLDESHRQEGDADLLRGRQEHAISRLSGARLVSRARPIKPSFPVSMGWTTTTSPMLASARAAILRATERMLSGPSWDSVAYCCTTMPRRPAERSTVWPGAGMSGQGRNAPGEAIAVSCCVLGRLRSVVVITLRSPVAVVVRGGHRAAR
jgi:hypothetical protein